MPEINFRNLLHYTDLDHWYSLSLSFHLQVARMVVVVSTMFVMSWSPFYLTTFVSQMQTVSFLRRANFVFVMLNIHLAGFLNSCLNPFIYSCMSRRFRESFRSILVSVICCGSPRVRTSRWGERIQSTYRYTSGTVLNNHKESHEDREKCIQLTDDSSGTVRRSNGRTSGSFKRNAFEREYTHEEEVWIPPISSELRILDVKLE